MEDCHKIDKYFDNNYWLYNTPYTKKKLLDYLDAEHADLFSRVDGLKYVNYESYSLDQANKKMSLLYEHEKYNLLNTYMNILD